MPKKENKKVYTVEEVSRMSIKEISTLALCKYHCESVRRKIEDDEFVYQKGD